MPKSKWSSAGTRNTSPNNSNRRRRCYRLCQELKEFAAYSDQLSNVRAALEWSFGPHGDDEISDETGRRFNAGVLELSLLIECQAWAERAIARLGNPNQNSRRAMEIYASLSLALMHTEGNDQRVRAAFSRALEIAINQGDLAYELRILSGLFMYSHWTMDIRGATDIAVRSKKLALKTGDPDDMALAEAMLAASDHLLGNHLVAQLHCEVGPPLLGVRSALSSRTVSCFITRASCSSAWHVLCCTEACSTNHWTMQSSP